MVDSIGKGVFDGIGELVKDTVQEAANEPDRIIEGVIGGSVPQGKKPVSKKQSDLANLISDDRAKSEREIAELKNQLGIEPKVKPESSVVPRRVEDEIAAVRREKEKKAQEEEALYEDMKKKKALEQEEAKQDAEEIIPKGKRPYGLPPGSSQGSHEKGAKTSI